MRNIIQLTFAVVLLTAGCASTGSKPDLSAALREVTDQNGRACIRTSRIKGYGVRSSHALNIDASPDYYIATLRPGCHDLPTSAAALFAGDLFEVCGGRFDNIVTRDGRCTIGQIFRFDSRDAAFQAYDAAEQWREAQ